MTKSIIRKNSFITIVSNSMKIFNLLICLIYVVSTGAIAQTYQQHGVVRMITTSDSTKIKPVAGVKVAVGNSMSNTTGSNGQFTMQVTKQFQVNGVSPSEEFVLALPTKGKIYYQSNNDLEVVVTTKVQKDADYKRLYERLSAKYDEQKKELRNLQKKYKNLQNEIAESDERRKRITDSLNFVTKQLEQIESEIRDNAEIMSLTDYVSLDSINRKIYDLKLSGDWKEMSEFINHSMNGNPRDFVMRMKEDRDKLSDINGMMREKEEEANRKYTESINIMEQLVKSFEMQHRHDSVMYYHSVLIELEPTNKQYLKDAADYILYEMGVNTGSIPNYKIGDYNKHITKAINYYEKLIALENGNNNLETAKLYYHLGKCLYGMGENNKALEFFHKQEEVLLSLKRNNDLAHDCYTFIGNIYLNLQDYEKAKECAKMIRENADYPTHRWLEWDFYQRYYKELSDYYVQEKMYDKAIKLIREQDKARFSYSGEIVLNNYIKIYEAKKDYKNLRKYLVKLKKHNEIGVKREYNRTIGSINPDDPDYNLRLRNATLLYETLSEPFRKNIEEIDKRLLALPK